MCALSRAIRSTAQRYKADLIIYDVGPNVGALNRTILLDSDYFATPVAADLFSLRALATVGRSLGRWIRDWETVRDLASADDRKQLLRGQPEYLGYITSAYKVSSGRVPTRPHEFWEKKIAPRVRESIVEVLRKTHPQLVPHVSNKIAAIKDFHSLAPQAQTKGLAMGKLKGSINPGYYPQVEEAAAEFEDLGQELLQRMKIKIKQKT
jgi:cellulose biosynthesis protein BcsQ